MDELDQRLMRAWAVVGARLRAESGEGVRRLKRAMGPTLQRPLRSWSLVLRADDKRLDEDAAVSAGRTGLVWLNAEVVRWLCAPVRIDWPGVSVAEAARLLGVNKTTVYRWSLRHDVREPRCKARDGIAGGAFAPRGRINDQTKPARHHRGLYAEGSVRLWRDVYVNEADRKRDEVLVWGERPVEPGGEVWSLDWGTLRLGLVNMVPMDFEQTLERVARACAGRSVVRRWRCPDCGESVGKLYWPMPVWTIPAALASAAVAAAARQPMGEGFACRLCAGLIYESAERGSRPRRGRHVDVWDRFVKRISGGLLRGAEV